MMPEHWPVWLICLFCIGGILFRPFRWPEAVWAVSAAGMLILFRLIGFREAWTGILKGLDVYLFLAGMMLMAETAREEKLFDWLAAFACRQAGGSSLRLFYMIYAVGTLVTILLSNDATAVVLTPAVAAAVRAAKIEKPLPCLLICAFIANAASFVLPISNPANLVIYGDRLPSLMHWIPMFALPSLVSIFSTLFLLKWSQRKHFPEIPFIQTKTAPLSAGGKFSGWGILLMTIVLLICSGLGIALGLPTLVCGMAVTLAISVVNKKSPGKLLGAVSWSVILLVAGLFVIVEALNHIGVAEYLAEIVRIHFGRSPEATAWAAGGAVAIGSNIVNNLPSGLLSGNVLQHLHPPEMVQGAVLIGVDLGPNLSVTGSLATILWLLALRRENISMSSLTFLKLGLLIMIPSLLLSLAALIYL